MTHQFTAAVNGFAAAGLSAAQASALRRRPDVLSVTPSRMLKRSSYSTPAFMGLSGPGGLWERAFGGPGAAAADVLIAIVDDGSDPSAEPFSATSPNDASALWPNLGPGSPACSNPLGGASCTAGKLLACRPMEAGANAFAAYYTPDITRVTGDIGTCASVEGHGVHVGSIAAGNFGSLPGGAGMAEGVTGGLSGAAPGAALGFYKVFWNYKVVDASGDRIETGAMEEDILGAFEQAIRDGADVINWSAGGGPLAYSFADPMWHIFRGAAAAGVLVAGAAGNEGASYDDESLASSVNENGAPWMITVAAGTHPRVLYGEVTLVASPGDAPVALRGEPGTTLVPLGPACVFVPTGYHAGLCSKDKLPEDAKGKIVICKRGVVGLFEKSEEVVRAGGVGMVLVNTETSYASLLREAWPIPTIHLPAASGATLLAALAAAGNGTNATIALSGQRVDGAAINEAPLVADFSSRGPSITDGYAILKPDILAPGVDILAAVPGGAAYWDGTSMATPAVAGLIALIKSQRPGWSPAAIRSALMTTAGLTTNRGRPIPGTPFDFGSGQADAAAALDPGLVYDAGRPDYDRYTCTAVDPKAWRRDIEWLEEAPAVPSYCKEACKGGGCKWPQALRDYNTPAFSLPELSRGQSVKARRTVTFVGPPPVGAASADGAAAVEFELDLQLPDGFTGKVKVSRKGAPSKAQSGASKSDLAFVSPGDTRSFTLSVTATKDAPAGWSFGSLTWRGGGGRWAVRSAIAIERLY
ncbi:MAG: peptidase S8/S53 domain-containing protein [Monoraphidium minutum]|nr:MAG: peptidase S8/S53 domain-containing protein [Monoraphidium minutum]